MTVVSAAIRKVTVTNYYSDVNSLNAPLVQPAAASYDDIKVNTSRAKKWWFLAYTLIRNPDLIKLRKRSGMETDSLVDPK